MAALTTRPTRPPLSVYFTALYLNHGAEGTGGAGDDVQHQPTFLPLRHLHGDEAVEPFRHMGVVVGQAMTSVQQANTRNVVTVLYCQALAYVHTHHDACYSMQMHMNSLEVLLC